ncbi:hypothetical protein [Planosporangium mesophilum]|uniref:Integrase n=1 Tax=Planosporangium mesophilum TaxID=689768 RepID=A0A8J3TA64_9ACTN|nr:hypothetical protein [Planosporangium mesophilum]NJC83126.1 hypothetical protein [Planosporangium mesophilum]GII22539.1 hypothetical protein Pme01_21360 [Planosporangium mesophilum]
MALRLIYLAFSRLMKWAVLLARDSAAEDIELRWVGIVRGELLDRMPVVGRRHLQSVLIEYVDHHKRTVHTACWGKVRRLDPLQFQWPLAVGG